MTSAQNIRKAIRVNRRGDVLVIGENPKLVVDLETQDNYIQVGQRRIPYKKSVHLSRDLLNGERKLVFGTAIRYHYETACSIAQGMMKAEEFRAKANVTVREKKEKDLRNI